jgi:hypothetical protein
MENRNGPCVQAMITTAQGVTESKAATELLARQIDLADTAPASLGADRSNHSTEVVGFVREHGIRPHIATVKSRKVAGLDGRTTRSLGNQTSQRIRKRIEEIFGWRKETGNLRRTRKRGLAQVGLRQLLILTRSDLVRMVKLLSNPPGTGGMTTAWAGLGNARCSREQ